MSQRRVIQFDDFSGGEWGNREAWKAQRNQFTGLNMLVYDTGELGVRAGSVNQTPSGVVTGVVRGFGYIGVPTADAWYVVGTGAHTFDMLNANNHDTATGSFGGTATTAIDSWGIGTSVHLAGEGLTGSYILDPVPATPTLTALTGAPAAQCITGYGDRLVLGDITGSNSFRLRYSAAANFNSWPAANFIDVGDSFQITGLMPQRQHLVVAKQTGMFTVTGTLGTNEVLRQLSVAGGPLIPQEMVTLLDDDIIIWPAFAAQPDLWNGARHNRSRHLDSHITTFGQGTAFPVKEGVARYTGSEWGWAVVSSTGNKMLTRVNGVTTYHTFGHTVSGFVSKQGAGDRLAICDGGGAATTAKFYLWSPIQNSPGIVGGTIISPGDSSSTTALSGSATFREEWSPADEEWRVRSVIVEFRKWNTGAANNNHFDLIVNQLRRYGGTSPTASNTVSFDETPASASASGTIDQRIFGFGEQGWGHGFQLAFSDCRGIAFQRISVIIDAQPVRV